MSTPALLDRLSQHRTLHAAPGPEISWIATRGVLRCLDTGGVLTHKNGTVEGLHVVLSGHLSIHVETGAGRRKVMEWRGGDVTGVMPYSRLVSPPGDVVAEEPAEIVTVHRKDLPDMIRECPELTGILVHVMIDRARHFTSSYLHDEKLVSLGKLAAGLAHELNNPASAISRAGGELAAGLRTFEEASRRIGRLSLTPHQTDVLTRVRDACLVAPLQSVLSPLEREAHEDMIADWLAGHGLAWSPAVALADSGITVEQLEQVAATFTGPALDDALQWLAAGCGVEHLAGEIRQAASRVSELVSAVKGFTQMDRAAVPEAVDVGQGIRNTLVVLRSKARAASVSLTVTVPDGLAQIRGFAGELNQVWTNLLENAIDAAGEGGRVSISVMQEDATVVVRVEDNGPGVPEGIRDRIFDPFFTTKPVGKGTGLGLDIVRRLVQRHAGRIELESVAGRTEFRVTLPVAGS